MKILIVGTGMFPIPPPKGGGAEKYTFNLAKELSKLGHEVHCINDVSDAKKLKGIRMYEVNPSKLNSPLEFKSWIFHGAKVELRLCKKSLEILSKENFDVIHVQDVKGNIPGLFLSFFKKTPIVFTMHGLTPWMSVHDSFFEQKFREFLWFASELHFLRRMDHIIVVNSNLRDHLTSWGISSDKISYIPNGVEDSFFVEKETGNIHRKYQLPSQYCLFVGQLVRRKGVKYLLKALDIAKNTKCVIVGSGPESQRLAKLFEKLKSQNKIRTLGNVPFEDLLDLYQSASFFVLPSISEVFGIVLLEAMASGLPVLVSDLPGLRDVVSENCNGFLVEPGNIDQLREKMEFLTENPDVCRRMGRNAERTVKGRYSWRAIAKKTMKVYKKVM